MTPYCIEWRHLISTVCWDSHFFDHHQRDTSLWRHDAEFIVSYSQLLPSDSPLELVQLQAALSELPPPLLGLSGSLLLQLRDLQAEPGQLPLPAEETRITGWVHGGWGHYCRPLNMIMHWVIASAAINQHTMNPWQCDVGSRTLIYLSYIAVHLLHAHRVHLCF